MKRGAAIGPPPDHLRSRAPKIGFYGCSRNGEARLVRVGVRKGQRSPKAAVVRCPACGERHQVDLAWRPLIAADKGLKPEVLVRGD